MDARSPRGERRRLGVLATVMALVAVATGIAVWSTVEALEERRTASAAADLRFAALTVSAADSIASGGGTPSLTGVAASMEQLAGNVDLALHALSEPERARAKELLTEIAGHGLALLGVGDLPAVEHSHDDLQTILGDAAERANEDAASAEQQALFAVGVAIAAMIATGWVTLRYRYRSASERAMAMTQLRASRRIERLLNDSPDMFVVLGEDHDITFASPSTTSLLGPAPISVDDLLARASEDDRAILHEHIAAAGQRAGSAFFELTDTTGTTGWFELRVSDLTDDELVRGNVVTARDITREVRLRDDLVRQAGTDMLTGLPNRRALDPTLDRAEQALEPGAHVAFLSLDLDGFKEINDTMGHHAGDDLLVQIARRLDRAMQPGQTLLRLGGDEFAVIIESTSGAADARGVAEHLRNVLAAPFRIGPRVEPLRTSIGVAVTDDPAHVGALVIEADIAMYQAKRAGGDGIAVFEPDMEQAATATSRVARALRAADYDAEFHLEYQPIVTVDATRTVGYEALLRWNSPMVGKVPPDEFIPVAETSGAICSIGAWVLDEVCRQIASWQEAGLDAGVKVSINVSARQLTEPGFVQHFLATAQSWGVPAERLVVEITESSVLDQAGTAQERLEALRDAGIRISIDDFGSGYSNLGQLLRVPFDVIKIDRSLLLNLSEMRQRAGGDTSGPCAIMEAIVSIAHVLRAPVLCEGVETDAQRESLRASGITYVQGYLTGPPMRPEQLLPPCHGADAKVHAWAPV